MKVRIGLLVLLIVFGVACERPSGTAVRTTPPPAAVSFSPSSPRPPAIPSPTPSPLGSFDADRAMGDLRAITSFGPRVKGSDEDERSSRYVHAVFAAIDCDVQVQEFPLRAGGTSRNIICKRPESESPHFVVGAHLDTVPGSPGANDNASGVAVVIELARLLHARQAAVEFIAFGAEERDRGTRAHHEGSLAYASSIEVSKVRGMLSVDMVGAGPSVYVVGDREQPSSVQGELRMLGKELGVPIRTTSEGDVSDHTSFSRRGVPAALLWSGRHPSYHTPSDTIAVVDARAMERTGRLALEWLRRSLSL